MFRPDPRVGTRQHTCGERSCQRKRRSKTQASWRSQNPEYPRAYRLAKRAARAAAAMAEPRAGREPVGPPPRPRLPAELRVFPWDSAEKALGFAGTDLLMVLAMLLVRKIESVKDPRAVLSIFRGVDSPGGRDP